MEVKMIYKHDHVIEHTIAIEKGIIAVENRKLRLSPHDQKGFNQD